MLTSVTHIAVKVATLGEEARGDQVAPGGLSKVNIAFQCKQVNGFALHYGPSGEVCVVPRSPRGFYFDSIYVALTWTRLIFGA